MNAGDVSEMDDTERLEFADKLATILRDSLLPELHPNVFTLESKIPFKATTFRELLIHRESDLADITLDLYKSNRLIPAFVTTRAVIETTAMMYWLWKKSKVFLEDFDDKTYDAFLMRGMLGSRDGTSDRESYNILTAVDHLDKEYNDLRKMYDRLCEFTHPNWSGVMGSYSRLDTENHILYLGKAEGSPPIAFGLAPLIGSLAIFQDYYNSMADILEAINARYK